MNAGDLAALAPLLMVSATAVAVMLAAAFRRNHALAAVVSFVGLGVAMLSLRLAWPLAPRPVTPLLIVDRYALLYTGLLLAAGMVLVLLAYPYLSRRADIAPGAVDDGAEAGRARTAGHREEYYLLLILAMAGSLTLVSSVHFASFFLGLELLSVSLYALVAYPRAGALSIEAGIKYLVLAGASSAFLLFGMALVYADLGTLEFARIAAMLEGGVGGGVLALAGLGMILVGIGFKLSLAPFHLWAPDVYEGAPAPATAFVATVSKGAVFVLLLRFVAQADAARSGRLAASLAVLAVASMFVGNWLALLQDNLKRLLAYSSIAHMGYLMVALLAGGTWARVAAAYYLAAYFVTTLGAFGVIGALSAGTRDADALADYHGLAWRRPWVAGVLTAMLLSLAGIPLTAGFMGKFYVLAAGVRSGLWGLAAALVINSAIGLFYYLRVIVAMYRPAAEAPAGPAGAARLAVPEAVAMGLLTLALLWMGVFPSPVIRLIQASMVP